MSDGNQTLTPGLDDQTVRTILEQFFAAYMKTEARGAPRIVSAPGHMFSDVAAKVVSIIGRASIQDLERVTRAHIDGRRFRANLYFEGGRPWEEFGWVGKRIRIGGTTLEGVKTITRCAATNVDPETAERDLNIPLALQDGFRHVTMGIYARVIEGGPIAVGTHDRPADLPAALSRRQPTSVVRLAVDDRLRLDQRLRAADRRLRLGAGIVGLRARLRAGAVHRLLMRHALLMVRVLTAALAALHVMLLALLALGVDQAIVVLRMLVEILGRNAVAGGGRVAREAPGTSPAPDRHCRGCGRPDHQIESLPDGRWGLLRPMLLLLRPRWRFIF